jgi:uncharacterized protein (DUF58 family)
VRLIFRILYVLDRIVLRLRHQIPHRLTPAGLAVSAGFIIVSVTALDTDNTVAYQAFILLLLLLLVSFPFVFFFKGRFLAVRSLPRFGTVGHPLSYRVVVTNLTPKTQRGLTLLENTLDPRPSFGEWMSAEEAGRKRQSFLHLSGRRGEIPFKVARVKEAEVPAILPNKEAEATVELMPLRRGVLRFHGVILGRPDPLGLFRAFAKVSLPQTVLILPKRYPLPRIALPGTTKYQEGGVTFASNVGQSEEFVALREYRRGDPLRHIHWRSWAKAGKPIVKEFEDEFFVRHALVLDTFTDDPRNELFEEAVSVAASFACAVLSQESLLDLLFVESQAYCFTAGRGLSHTDQILEILAAVRPSGQKRIRTLESLVLDHAAMVSGCVCVLLAWDPARQDLVKKLKALDVPVLVLVLAEAGRAKSIDPGPLRGGPVRFQVLEIGRIEEDLANIG